MAVTVRDMTPDDAYFVGTCSHVHESAETDACAARRLAYFERMQDVGLRIKVARVDDQPVGMIYSAFHVIRCAPTAAGVLRTGKARDRPSRRCRSGLRNAGIAPFLPPCATRTRAGMSRPPHLR